jgi:5-methylcytosine-specific restriction endonuclease McrA
MIGGHQQQLRPRLDPEDYRALKLRVLERDGWRCQCCGRRDQLEVHHLIRRSQLGPDDEENLIVLCNGCHRVSHDKKSLIRERELTRVHLAKSFNKP